MKVLTISFACLIACGDNIHPPGPGDVPPNMQCTVKHPGDGDITSTGVVCQQGGLDGNGRCSCDNSAQDYNATLPDGVFDNDATEMCDLGITDCNGDKYDGCRPGDLTFAFPDCAFQAEVSGIAGADIITRGGDHDDTVSVCPDPNAMRPDPFTATQELRDPGNFGELNAIGGVHVEVQDCRYLRHDYTVSGADGFTANSTFAQGDMLSAAGDWVIDGGHFEAEGHSEIHEARFIAKTVPSNGDPTTFYMLANGFFTQGTRQESDLTLDIEVPTAKHNGTSPNCVLLDPTGADRNVTGCPLRDDVKMVMAAGVLGDPSYCRVELVSDGSLPANGQFCPGEDGPLLNDCSGSGQNCCGYTGPVQPNRPAECAAIAYAGTIKATWDAPGDLYLCDCACDDPSAPGAQIVAPIQGCAEAGLTDPQAVCNEACGGVFCTGAAGACDVGVCHPAPVSQAPYRIATSVCDSDHQPFVRVAPDGDYRVDVDPRSSSVVFHIGGVTSGAIPINGAVHFNVSSGSPRIVEFADIDLRPEDFSLKGQTITNAGIVTVERVHGQMFDDATFEVPPGIGVFAVRATLNGSPAGVNVVNPEVITGSIDFTSSPPRFSLDVSGQDVQQGEQRSMTAHIEGVVGDLPPHADTSRTATRVECTGPGLTSVTLDGTASTDSDPGDSVTHYQWFRQAATGVTNQATAHVPLPLGVPTAFSLHVYDRELGANQANTTVTVVDSTPPALNVSPSTECAWPPDHKLQCFTLGSDVQVSVTDTCDPSPVVKIASVVSNQPDDGTGDGDTAADVSWTGAQFCVRRERAATLGARTYTAQVTATDHSGNTSTQDITVTVPLSGGCRPSGR